MPLTDLGSYITTGQDFETHWTGVNANRVANALAELALPDDYAVGDLTLDIAAISSANTDVTDLENAFDIAVTPRDNSKKTLRKKLMNFRKAVSLRLPGSGYERALPKTFRISAREEATLKALDDMASIWIRVNAYTGSPDFTPPLILRGNYTLAMFTADLATLRANYKAVRDAEEDLRFARKQRDVLLDPFRIRLVTYRKAIADEYGEEHPFFLSLPDIYPGNGGGGGPTLEQLRYYLAQTGPSMWDVWIEMKAGLVDVQTLYFREGTIEYFTAFSPQPGEVFKTSWSGVTISGPIDEVKVRNSQNEDIAEGLFDPMLPDPAP